MEIVLGFEGCLNVARPGRVSRLRIEINHAIKFLAFTDPLVNGLTGLLLFRAVEVIERRNYPLEGVLKRRRSQGILTRPLSAAFTDSPGTGGGSY